MSAVTVGFLLLAANPWFAPRQITFGEGAHWTIIDVHGYSARSLDPPGMVFVKRLASSADARVVAFSGATSVSGSEAVFVWLPNDPTPPRQVSAASSYSGDVSISADGRWVYYVSSSSGPPGAHAVMDYNQLFRVSASGGVPEQLTSNAGCHLLPEFVSERLFFLHTSCRGDRWIEWRPSLNADDHRIASLAYPLVDLAISPDGKKALSSYNSLGETHIIEGDVALNKLRPVLTFPSTVESARPQYGATSGEVVYQAEDAVWLSRNGSPASQLCKINAQEHLPQ